jgi:hypothetical protein
VHAGVQTTSPHFEHGENTTQALDLIMRGEGEGVRSGALLTCIVRRIVGIFAALAFNIQAVPRLRVVVMVHGDANCG